LVGVTFNRQQLADGRPIIGNPELRDLLSGQPVYREGDLEEGEANDSGDRGRGSSKRRASKPQKAARNEGGTKGNASKVSILLKSSARREMHESKASEQQKPPHLETLQEKTRINCNRGEAGGSGLGGALSEAATWPIEIGSALQVGVEQGDLDRRGDEVAQPDAMDYSMSDGGIDEPSSGQELPARGPWSDAATRPPPESNLSKQCVWFVSLVQGLTFI
jgi:hypothetical protein